MDFLNIRIFDLIDILILSFFSYFIIRLFRGTRAGFMFLGVFILLLLAFISFIFDLAGTKLFFNGLKTIGLIAFIIIFQPEIRRLLTSFGRLPLLKGEKIKEEKIEEIINILVKASFSLRDKGYGAIIVIEGKMVLSEYTDKALFVDAKISEPLFLAIFNPISPVHDGACVIKDDRIKFVRCILPVSDSPLIDISLGTRHRAAIGITEQSDCFAIVVSEEKREVSFAYQGKLIRRATRDTLKRNLEVFYKGRL
ncbi:MAG: diadenylate cyclase CdaA [candidate division WOR-3 bacterium]